MTMGEAAAMIRDSELSKVFVMDDWVSKQNFWKQFLSGAFIAIVMTGLDQDMMQKNLTCRSLRDAQKDMCTYGMAFLPANLVMVCLCLPVTTCCRNIFLLPLPSHLSLLASSFLAWWRRHSPVRILP